MTCYSHFVKKTTKRPNIRLHRINGRPKRQWVHEDWLDNNQATHLLIIFLVLADLRRKIIRSSNGRCCQLPSTGQNLADPEVTKLQKSTRWYKDILALDIPFKSQQDKERRVVILKYKQYKQWETSTSTPHSSTYAESCGRGRVWGQDRFVPANPWSCLRTAAALGAFAKSRTNRLRRIIQLPVVLQSD